MFAKLKIVPFIECVISKNVPVLCSFKQLSCYLFLEAIPGIFSRENRFSIGHAACLSSFKSVFNSGFSGLILG